MNFLWDNVFKREKKENDLATILKDNFIFETLSGKEIKFIKDIVHIRQYRPGEAIFHQGEIGVGMYIIKNGNVDISVEDRSGKAPTAHSTFITRLDTGDFFGEIALVEEGSRRTATATARDEVTLIGFFKSDLEEVTDRSPMTGVRILTRLSQVLGRRLKETAEKVSDLKIEINKLGSSKKEV